MRKLIVVLLITSIPSMAFAQQPQQKTSNPYAKAGWSLTIIGSSLMLSSLFLGNKEVTCYDYYYAASCAESGGGKTALLIAGAAIGAAGVVVYEIGESKRKIVVTPVPKGAMVSLSLKW